MIDRKELEKLATKYQDKADRAYRDYQETGITRYDRERRNAEDLAEALRAALNASEEHQALGHLRAEFAWLANLADEALDNDAPKEKLAEILEQVVSSATVYCRYKRRERRPSGDIREEENA